MHSILVVNFIPHSALYYRIKSNLIMYEYIYLLCAGVYHIVENIQDSKIIFANLVKGRLFGKFWHAKILTLVCIYLSNWM